MGNLKEEELEAFPRYLHDCDSGIKASELRKTSLSSFGTV